MLSLNVGQDSGCKSLYPVILPRSKHCLPVFSCVLLNVTKLEFLLTISLNYYYENSSTG